jgi:hypothetical protein
MNKDPKEQEKLYAYLIGTFQSSALIALGVMKNPMSNEVVQNLNQASYYINLLEMLEHKTKGNVSEYEKQMLLNTLSDLKIKLIEQTDLKNGSKKS